MSPRALRRHHEGRAKRCVRDYYGGYARADARATGKLAHTRRLCSCWLCGNPRRCFGETTLQECRAECAPRDE